MAAGTPQTPSWPPCGTGFSPQAVALGRDDSRGPGVPYDQVGIRAHGHPPLPRVKVEDFGRVRTGHGNEFILIHLPRGLRSQKAGSGATLPSSTQGLVSRLPCARAALQAEGSVPQ